MAYTDQRLYRAQALEPVLGYDDVAYLIDANGPVNKYASDSEGPGFFGVKSIRPTFGWGPHGLFVIWTQGAIPAGYAAPTGVPTGSITAGNNATFVAPAQLALGSYGLVQVRWSVGVLALTGAVALQDLDVTQLVGSIQDFNLPNLSGSGVANMMEQMQEPSDSIVDPAQNANRALPATFPADNPFDNAQLRETFWFENNPPSWRVTNNGGATITGGTVGLRFSGFRYFLSPLLPDGSWLKRWIAGDWRLAPPVQRIVTIPTVPATGTTSF
jgi:hypothetical protein